MFPQLVYLDKATISTRLVGLGHFEQSLPLIVVDEVIVSQFDEVINGSPARGVNVMQHWFGHAVKGFIELGLFQGCILAEEGVTDDFRVFPEQDLF
jgi:hypothetical protein